MQHASKILYLFNIVYLLYFVERLIGAQLCFATTMVQGVAFWSDTGTLTLEIKDTKTS
jgi:hypothetical protein